MSEQFLSTQPDLRPNILERAVEGAVSLFSPKNAFLMAKQRRAYKAFSYEAGDQSIYRRTSGFFQNSSPESSLIQLQRVNMMWSSRDLSDNSGVVDGIYRMYGDYVIGNLHDIRPNTGNTKDDDYIRNAWKYWCMVCDATGQLPFGELIRLAQRCYLRDGDTFLRAIPVSMKMGGITREELTLQLIEADCVGSPYNITTTDSYMGGVNIDRETGRVQTYEIYYRDPAGGTYTKIGAYPADEIIQIMKPRRVGQYRGIPLLAPALNAFKDLKEIFVNERVAVKMLSSLSLYVQTGLGDASDDSSVYNSSFGSVNPVTGQPQQLKNMQPGQVWYGNPGEEPIQMKSDRPSPAFQGLVKSLFRDAFIAAGIDFAFAYDGEGIAGTYARLSSAKTERTFRREWNFLNDNVLQKIYTRWFIHEMGQGRMEGLGAKTIKNQTWMNPRWVRPSHPTADVGRESAADMAEFNAKIRSASTILEEQGLEWEDEAAKILQEENDRSGGNTNTIDNLANRIGERGTQALTTFITAYGAGQIPKEVAIGTAEVLFGITTSDAEKMFPPVKALPIGVEDPNQPDPAPSNPSFSASEILKKKLQSRKKS